MDNGRERVDRVVLGDNPIPVRGERAAQRRPRTRSRADNHALRRVPPGIERGTKMEIELLPAALPARSRSRPLNVSCGCECNCEGYDYGNGSANRSLHFRHPSFAAPSTSTILSVCVFF